MSGSELEQAVDGFRRAEAALAAITDDAKKIASTSAELDDARAALAAAGEDLKVVAGALVGLATAHRELVAQLGNAAAALGQSRPLEIESGAADGEVVEHDAELVAALRRAEDELEQSAKIDQVMLALAEMGDRLVAALADVEESRQPALAAGPAEGSPRVFDRIDEVERRLGSSQHRIFELVLVQGLAFLVLAAMIGYLAIR
jgi:chromosome segregation ATPase